MSEVRRDPLTGREVVLRADRIPPAPAYGPGTMPQVGACPFCPGAEAQTRDTIAQRPAEGDWQVRAFANRRPGLLPELHSWHGDGVDQHWAGVGAHEVIVESRSHDSPSQADQQATFHLAADRLQDLTGDARFQALGWYRNRCIEAGSSQPHPHSQVVATPHVPRLLDVMADVFTQRPDVLLQQIDAAGAADRIVLEHDGVVAFAPWAPMFPYEVWITPRRPASQLWHSRGDIDALATVVHAIETALDGLAGRCARNLVLYGAPLRDRRPFSWHLRVMPRLQGIAGFELWTAGALHPIFPEAAAAALRGFVP